MNLISKPIVTVFIIVAFSLFFSAICLAQTPYAVQRQANSSRVPQPENGLDTDRMPPDYPTFPARRWLFRNRGWQDEGYELPMSRRPGVPGSFASSDPSWTQHLIKNENRTHDFGTVAKGSRAEHRFVISNAFQEDVRIASVSSSCSCTTVSLLNNKNSLQTYEKATIVAQFRADLFDGHKSATITVVIDKPHYAEFHLNVQGDIRSDITLRPDAVRFDNVKEGEGISRTVEVVYMGYNPAWKIVDFKSTNEHLSGKIEDVKNSYGAITTKIRIALDEKTPVGSFVDRLYLVTNDPGNRREIPVLVQGTVGTVVSVTPETLFFGYLQPGEAAAKIVVVQGSKPFRIKSVTCDNPAVVTTFKPKEDDPPKARYILPMRYLNPKDGDGAPKDGKMRTTVKIETDLHGLAPSFNVMMELAKEEAKPGDN